MCNAVDTLAIEAEIPTNSAHICREWERIYKAQTQEFLAQKDTPVIEAY